MYATHNYWKGKNDSHSENIIKNGTSPLYEYRNKGKSNYDGAWSYLYLNTEYQLSKKSTIEVYTGGSLYNGKYSYKSTAYKNDFSTNIWDSIQSLNDYDYGGQTSYYAGSSFNHNFNDKGHKLNIDLYGWGWDSSPEGNSSQIYTVETMNNKMRRNYPQNSSSSVNLNSDYTYPINDSTSIEAGINASTSHSKDMNMTDSLDFLTNTWHFDEQISDRYKDNDKNVNAYVSYNGKLWGVGYKIGVRSEYKEYHLNSISMNRQFTRDFFNLYPSLHLSYSTKGMDNFTLSYSRRVEYPDYQLNPYIDYSDVEWIYGGNPNLKSSYTNSFEAGYAKYFKKGGSFSVSLYHRYTDKDITYYTTSVYDTVLNRNTLYSTYANSGTNAFTGGEITANYQPAKFISLMANANLYNLKISAHMKTSDTSSYDIDRDNFSWDGKLSCNLTIVKTVKWQITGIYRSENKSLVGSSDPVYYINTSIRSDFFNRKLSVNVGVQDIFDWQKTKGTTSTPTYSGSSSNKQVTRYLTAGITLRLGKIEMEKEMKTGQDKSGKQ
ncbi:MAG: outer membrane beta-barrel family protein [Lentimicrobiaceae bacterium]|nr:outer membrane beta-barrel family protein [Lentimicrobiaceae bacterium]